MRWIWMAAAILLAAAPAAAQKGGDIVAPEGGIVIAPGQSILLHDDFTSESAGPAEFNKGDEVFLKQIRATYKAGNAGELHLGQGSAENPPPPPPEHGARIRFIVIDGKESVLVFDNGMKLGISYRARMKVDGAWHDTDVCLIVPERHGYEHWPHAIEAIEISQIAFQPWRQGDEIPCR